ncbi:unnamed protein product [Closterium sp. NIES-54]
MVVLIREFQSPDEEMKKIVLKVVKQCVGTNGVEPDYICTEILPEYFKQFWVHRMALDRRNYKQLVETTVEIANKHSTDGVEPDYTRTEILPEYFKHFWVRRMVLDKRNYKQLVETTVEIANKAHRMVMETVEKVLTNLGAADIGTQLEDLLIDGILSTFKEPVGTGYVGDSTWVGTWGVGMVMETVEKVLTNLGDADIDAR